MAPPSPRVRLNETIACLNTGITLLNDVYDAFGTPFLLAISNTASALIVGVQNAKRNKDECIQLVDHIHGLIYAIVDLHFNSVTPGSVPPAILHDIGRFADTLHKIHTFVEAQQEGNKIKHFFRQSEMNTLLGQCRAGLQHAQEVFKLEFGATILSSVNDMQRQMESMHKELLELISSLSDGTASQWSSIMQSSSHNSLTSFSMLPSEPKIFHGREMELDSIVKLLNQDSARIAILGAGGMGKTTLARAALHHPKVAATYELRFFVACDSSTTSIELATLIGTHLGLDTGKDLRKPVIQYFSRDKTSLLVLDNLETTWEPRTSRGQVEEFLSLLTDLPHLALLITMHGAERPGRVQWTHPCLPPLKPLSNDAARQTFIDIADDFHNSDEINQILSLTDNMPLAIDLIAHLVDHEGCPNVLFRWETEKTSLLSKGFDRKSNLDASITVSLSSPRITSLAGARELLSLLSILPDGLSDFELLQTSLPFQNPLACKVALLGTALAYTDANKRLKSLVPIREHVLYFYPPTASLIRPLRKYFSGLLDLFSKTPLRAGTVGQMTSNLGNLHNILHEGLHVDHPDIADTIKCIISFNRFHRITGRARPALMDQVPAVFPRPCDHELELAYLSEEIASLNSHPHNNPDLLISLALSHLPYINNPALESTLHSRLGWYYCDRKGDLTRGLQSFDKALALEKSSSHTDQESETLNHLAEVKFKMGDYAGGQAKAREAQRLAKLSANLHQEARALRTEVLCSTALGNYHEGILLIRRARELIHLTGMTGGIADVDTLNLQAEVHRLKSEYAEARNIHQLKLVDQTSHQSPINRAFTLLNIADIDIMTGAAEVDVKENLREATSTMQSLHYSGGLIYCEATLAALNFREGKNTIAMAQFQQCLSSMWGRDNDAVSYCLERLSDISRWDTPNFEPESTWAVIYLAHAHKFQKKLDLYKALQFVGDIFMSDGNEYTAKNLFMVALEGFTYMDIHRSRGDCMLHLGDLAQKQGNMPQAVGFWREARSLFERSSQAKDVEKIDRKLAYLE